MKRALSHDIFLRSWFRSSISLIKLNAEKGLSSKQVKSLEKMLDLCAKGEIIDCCLYLVDQFSQVVRLCKQQSQKITDLNNENNEQHSRAISLINEIDDLNQLL